MNFGKCARCVRKAVTAINGGDTPLCAFHYVQWENEECLKSRLLENISENRKITENKEIQLQIKKQYPKLYDALKEYFTI